MPLVRKYLIFRWCTGWTGIRLAYLVLAKRRSALRALHALFREGEVEKNYMALVVGDWQQGDVMIDAPLLVRNRRNGERHVVVSASGKPAVTRISLARRFGTSSLVQCQPQSGRTHQIRVHAAHAGHPIAGDERYGDAEQNAKFAQAGLRRLFLHAQSIAFPDEHGNELHFTAPLSPDLDRFLSKGAGKMKAETQVKGLAQALMQPGSTGAGSPVR